MFRKRWWPTKKISERDGGQQKKFRKKWWPTKKVLKEMVANKKVPKEMVANKKSFNSGDQY